MINRFADNIYECYKITGLTYKLRKNECVNTNFFYPRQITGYSLSSCTQILHLGGLLPYCFYSRIFEQWGYLLNCVKSVEDVLKQNCTNLCLFIGN